MIACHSGDYHTVLLFISDSINSVSASQTMGSTPSAAVQLHVWRTAPRSPRCKEREREGGGGDRQKGERGREKGEREREGREREREGGREREREGGRQRERERE